MKRFLIALVLFVYIHNAHSQTNNQAVSMDYQQWLAETPLGGLFEVSHYDEKNKKLVISVKARYASPASIKKVYVTWDSLSVAYKNIEVSLASVLFNKLKQIILSSPNNLSIEITSNIPILFSVIITLKEGNITESVQYIDDKGSGNNAINTEGILFYSDFIPLKLSIRNARKIVSKRTKKFFKERFEITNSEINQEINGNSHEKYVVEKKGIITDNYNDRIELNIWYIPISDSETEINFEFNAFYARGIMATGQYKEIDLSYLPILIDIQKSYKNLLNSP